MSFLNIAQDIKKSGFDPRKDSINMAEKLPVGMYTVMLKKVLFNVSDKKWKSLGYTFEVKDGDYKGKKEFAVFGLMTEWNGKDLTKQVRKSIKFFQKAITLSGDDTLKKDFEDGITLQEALERKAVGSLYNLLITENECQNKIYRNYDLEEYKQEDYIELPDDELPF